MSNLSEINAKDAYTMLHFLHGDGAYTFQTLPEGGQGQSPRILHGHLDKFIVTLTELNTSGSGVFVCVNETDLKGRKSDNIIRVRALSADFDAPDSHRVEWLLSLSLPPNMIIESSPGKHHAYWVFNVGEISLTEFRPLQQRIAIALGSDEKICDLSRVLRVAGFWHQKGEPFLTRVCHIDGYYTADQIKDFARSLKADSQIESDSQLHTSFNTLKLGDMPLHIKQAKNITTLWDRVAPLYVTNIEELNEALSFIPSDDREIWRNIGIALRNSDLDNAYDIWCEWSTKSDKYDLSEQQKTWGTLEGYNRVTLGTIYHLAAKHGYRRPLKEESITQFDASSDSESDSEPQGTRDPDFIESEIKKLAALSLVEYDLQRASAIKRLGIQAKTLDARVKFYQTEASKGDNIFEDDEVWHDRVDGTALLNELESTIKKYIVLEPHVATAAALWIMFSWCIDAMKIAPIACITAPEKRCGKSQFLTLIGRLVRRPQMAVSITTAALFRMISEYAPTLLIDEADAFLKDNEELRGILNGGHDRQTSHVIRTVGDDHKIGRFNVWGAKAISGIGHLPETLRDRSILLELRRKKKGEKVERLRYAPDEVFEVLRQKLHRWSLDNLDDLKQIKPSTLDELNDRAQDNWEPLFIIADCVGGDWSERARQCALTMNSSEQDPQSVGEELLTDIKKVFDECGVDRMSTADLIAGLCQDEESRWRTFDYGKWISSQQLAKRLKAFHVKSSPIRTNKGVHRGYMRESFSNVFSSYLGT